MSASSTIRPWNRASASATPCPSSLRAAARIAVEVAREPGEVGVGHPRDGEPGGERLEARADRVRLDDLAASTVAGRGRRGTA